MSRLNVNSVNAHSGVYVNVTGSTDGGLIISASPSNDGKPVLQVHGSISASGELTCSNALFTGDIRVIGEAVISASAPGGIYLGDANTDNVIFGADISSSIIPDVDDAYDLGTNTQQWKDIYIDGVGYVDALDQSDVTVTNNLKGDWHWKDDGANVSLFVNSADGNVGVKVSDPNQELEVAGRISASQQLSVGGAGTTDGHITGSGNLVISGAYGIEVLNHITASGNISASGDLSITGKSFFNGHITASGVISASLLTATHSLGGQLNIADQISIIKDGGAQGRIGIGTLTPAEDHRLHILVENSVDQSLMKYQTNAGTATHGIYSTGNHYIHSTKTGGALELGAAGTTLLTISSSGDISGSATSNLILGGHVTASGNISASGNIIGNQITSYGNMSAAADFEVLGTTTLGDASSDPTIVHGNLTASVNISSSAIVSGLKVATKTITDYAGTNTITDDGSTITVENRDFKSEGYITGTHITASGVISASLLTATHSFGGEINIADQVSIMDGGGQGRIGIGTLTPDSSHRLHILVENSANQSLMKYQTNAGTATHGIYSTGNHYIHSTKVNGALELGPVTGTSLFISASGNISASANFSALNISASGDLSITGESFFGGHITSSANISSSGHIIGDQITSYGNMSAQADFEALGNMTMGDAATDVATCNAQFRPGAGGMMRSTPVLMNDANQTLTIAANAGRTNVIPDVTSDRVYKLPTPTVAGQYFHFIYGGAAADAEGLQIRTLTTDNSVYCKGAITHLDTDADNVAVFANGTNHEILTLDLCQAVDLHFLAISTTVWYVWGSVCSQTAPVWST